MKTWSRAVNLGGGGRAALLFLIAFMSGTFTYGPSQSPPTINPSIDYPRILMADTNEFDANGNPVYIFSDQEIQMLTNINASTFQSSQFYSFTAGQFIPPSPPDYYRIAALGLDSIAANKSRLSSIMKLLDVQLDPSKAAAMLRAQAAEYRDLSDNAGSFAIIEQVNDYWSFSDRFWKQVQRQQGV